MGRKKREKIFFQKHTYIASNKRWKKVVWKKCENTFFINTRISLPKNGGKNREKFFFPKHTYIASYKRWKKIVWKKCENTFFINRGKNSRKNFSQKHRFRKQTTMEKNRLEKLRKHVFYKHTNIVTKKWGEKTRKNFFPETHVHREL